MQWNSLNKAQPISKKVLNQPFPLFDHLKSVSDKDLDLLEPILYKLIKRTDLNSNEVTTLNRWLGVTKSLVPVSNFKMEEGEHLIDVGNLPTDLDHPLGAKRSGDLVLPYHKEGQLRLVYIDGAGHGIAGNFQAIRLLVAFAKYYDFKEKSPIEDLLEKFSRDIISQTKNRESLLGAIQVIHFDQANQAVESYGAQMPFYFNIEGQGQRRSVVIEKLQDHQTYGIGMKEVSFEKKVISLKKPTEGLIFVSDGMLDLSHSDYPKKVVPSEKIFKQFLETYLGGKAFPKNELIKLYKQFVAAYPLSLKLSEDDKSYIFIRHKNLLKLGR